MSSNVEKLLVQVANFEKLAKDSLDKDSKKLDSKPKKSVKKDEKDKKSKKDNKKSKKSSEYYDSFLNKYAQQTVPTGHKQNTENVEQDWKDWEAMQGAKVRQPTSFTRDVPPVVNNEGKVDWSRTDQGGATADFELPDTSPAPAAAPARPTIPFRADVRAAQIQFNKWNKQNGNYAAPIAEDGQLGPKTKSAFSGFRPGADVEAIIKELSEQGMSWNSQTQLPPPPLPAPGKLELDKSDPWAKPAAPPSAAPTSTTASFAEKFFSKLS